jgi:hypothetical protein
MENYFHFGFVIRRLFSCITCRDFYVEIFVETLNPDDSSEDGLRQRDDRVRVDVVALPTKVLGLFDADSHENFLKLNKIVKTE